MPRSFDSVFYGAAGGGVDLPSDDQFNRVSFLSHFDGANNGVNNAFDDGSSSNHTITARFNSTQGSFGPFARPDGEWGVDLTPSGGFLRATGAGDISGDFTIETWVYMNKDNGNYIHFTYNSGGLMNVFNVYNGSVQNFLFGTSSTAGQTTLVFNDTTWDAGVWTHLAAVRSSGTLKIYVNGVADATTSTAVSGNLTDLEYIGTGRGFTDTPNSRLFDGIVSNVRFSSTARYTSNFTPSTAYFTSDSDTNLLTCQSNRFVDNSSNGHTITPSGTAAVTAFGPFLTSSVYDPAVNGASGYFDGTDDLTIPTSSDFNLSNNPFTFSFWANFSDGGTVYGRYYYPTGKRETFISTEDTGAIRIRVSETGGGYSDHATASGVFVFNQWNYIVITRTISGSDSVFKTYVNGTLSKTTTIGFTTINYDNQVTYIMNYGYVDDRPTGYLCDFKLVNGTATAPNSSNPTAPATNTTNTKLLLNMKDGQAIDSAALNNLTLFGTAKLSTGQAKFGDTSILFDGNSDFLTFPHSESNDISGAGNWTVEFFWRFVDNNATQYQEIATKGIGFQIYGNNGALSIALSANNTTTYFLSANNGTTLSDNTWYHIAAVKNGTAYNVYLNGTNEANLDVTSSSNVDTGTDPWCLGAYTSNSYYANGYMDEFRVSHFARYTSNFTAPTEPFADKGQDA